MASPEIDQPEILGKQLLPVNPRTTGLPQEILLTIISFALDKNFTFDRLVEIDDVQEVDRARTIAIEGDSRHCLLRTETWLSTVCSTWRNWIYIWQSVGFNKLPPHELRVTGKQWLNPSFPMPALLSIHAFRPYPKLYIYFSNFVTPPASLDRSETTALLFPLNSNERQRPEFSSCLEQIRLTLSNQSSVALDSILGAYDFPPHFKIIFTFNSGSRMFLSSFTSVQIDPLMHLTFEINSWRAGLGAEVPSTIASIASWIWPSGGVGKSIIEVKLPRNGYEFRELTKDWKRRSTPSFVRDWDFDEIILERFGGGSMVLDFFTCAGIRILTRHLVLISYPMEICSFYDCHCSSYSPIIQPEQNMGVSQLPGLITSPTPTEVDAPLFPKSNCPNSNMSNSNSFAGMGRPDVLCLAPSPHRPSQASPSLPPSPPLETATEVGQPIRQTPRLSPFLRTPFPRCHECHKFIDRQPYDLTWILHGSEIDAKHTAQRVGIALCEGERLLPLEGYQLEMFSRAGIVVWAIEEDSY